MAGADPSGECCPYMHYIYMSYMVTQGAHMYMSTSLVLHMESLSCTCRDTRLPAPAALHTPGVTWRRRQCRFLCSDRQLTKQGQKLSLNCWQIQLQSRCCALIQCWIIQGRSLTMESISAADAVAQPPVSLLCKVNRHTHVAPAVCRHVPGCLCRTSTGTVCYPSDTGAGWQCRPAAGPAGLVQRAPASCSYACMPDANPQPAADEQRQGGQAGVAPAALCTSAACC